MQSRLSFAVVLSIGIILARSAAADLLSVGIGPEYDFATIQAALDASRDGDYVDISAGIYPEELVVPARRDLVITGVSTDPTAVVVTGSITVEKGCKDVELQYLVVEAGGRDFGIQVMGQADLKYGQVRGAVNGIVVTRTGSVELFEQVSSNNTLHGLVARNSGAVEIEESIFADNGGAGVRGRSNRKRIRVNESILTNNKYGVFIKDTSAKNQVTKSTISSNEIGIRLVDAPAYISDNTYSDNGRNVVRRRS